jgi:menaquinone-dependent protoporphyrinogen oxidase
MAGILILYGTTEGQTATIAAEIAAVVRGLDHHAEVLDSTRLPDDFVLANYDALIIGASIHAGRYQRRLVDFVKNHRMQLDQMPAALFLVSLSAAKTDAEGREWVNQCSAAFRRATGWQPHNIAHFAGALKYREYGLVKRWLMQRIARQAGGDTDTSRDYEYTDWDQVVNFARAFVDGLAETGVNTRSGP